MLDIEEDTHHLLKAMRLWSSVFFRCYSGRDQFKSYKDCSVSPRWHDFNVFQADLKTLQGYEEWISCDDRTVHFDKDTKVPGNRVYSLEACIFLNRTANTREACLRRWGVDPDTYEPIEVGKRYENLYGQYEVLQVNHSKDVTVKFDNTGYVWRGTSRDARTGKAVDRSLGYTPTKRQVQVGQRFKSTYCGEFEVIEFLSPKEVKIKFDNTGVVATYPSTQIRSGTVSDGTNRLPVDFKERLYLNNYGQSFRITEYTNATTLFVTFCDTGFTKKTTLDGIRRGVVPDQSDKGKEYIELFRTERSLDKKDVKNIKKALMKIKKTS